MNCTTVQLEANFGTTSSSAVEFHAPIKGTRNNTPLPVKHSLRWREDACVDTVKERKNVFAFKTYKIL